MSIIPFHGNWYSDIIVYDERKKYFYMWARKNRPFLDDEIRAMNLATVDQIRRSMQHTFGTVGSPTETYSSAVGANEAFKIVESIISNENNFTIKGGDGTVENPAVIFAKGFYIFLMGDIDYDQQTDLGKNLTDDGFTETPIPSLTPPVGSDRVDIVYIDLHFSEASAVTGSGRSEYQDTNLKNPIIGTETANRARAVFDIRVWEDWKNLQIDCITPRVTPAQLDKNIFTSNDFLGEIILDISSDPNPMNKHYKIPIAVLYRSPSDPNPEQIKTANIINLFDLYDKRILNLSELTYRMNHGGYTQRDADELNFGITYPELSDIFTPRFPYAKVDESAYATGANQGIGTEAFNSDSVTPRVLDETGKFAVGSLLVGRETGSITYPIDSVTGPEQLINGEIVSQDISVKAIYVGYDRGITGIREYKDRINVNMQGMTGDVGLDIINKTGETGTACAVITTKDNFTYVDYKGRHGINTNVPGWSGPDSIWNTEQRFTGTDDVVNIVSDINDSQRITEHLFVEKDSYVKRDSYGPSWKIPGDIDRQHPVLFGFTGVSQIGLTGSPASLQVVPGIAVMGVTGSLEGYTGTFGFYEAYDDEGQRIFTLGSKGDNFDRQVLSLYGSSEREVFEADVNFFGLPGDFVGTEILAGDTVTYDITLKNGDHINRTVGPLSGDGYTGVLDIANDINSPTGGEFYRIFEYEYAVTRPYGDTGLITYLGMTGIAQGAVITADDNYLRLLVKSMPEVRVDDETLSIDQVEIALHREGIPNDLIIDFIQSGYFGSSMYGGDIIDLRFVKFDLGEAADAFMFNGDVYFNGNGLLNRVTFSPIAMFRNDVYVYGKVVADRLLIQLANFNILQVDRDALITQYMSVVGGLALGFEPYPNLGINAIATLKNTIYDTQYHIKELVNGGIRANNLNLYFGSQPDYSDFGIKWDLATYQNYTNVVVSVLMNGSNIYDLSRPFGIHFVDNRLNVAPEDKYGLFVIDGTDAHGDPAVPYNVLLWVKGNLHVGIPDTSVGEELGGGILAKRLTLGLTSTDIDEQYVLSLKNGTAYIENLTVKSIQYDATNPGSAAFFTNPQNIIVVQPSTGDTAFNKDQGITRRKEFSFDTYTNPPAVLYNTESLGGSDADDYPRIATNQAIWAHDSLSFTKDVISSLSSSRGDDTITTTDFNVLSQRTNWEIYRDNFSRIIVANLGTLTATWNGYYNATDHPNDDWTDNAREKSVSYFAHKLDLQYTFSSSLFKSTKDGSSVFDWSVPTNNFVANLRASFNNNDFANNALYNLNKTLGIFVSTDSWMVHEKKIDVSGTIYYERILYYPYINKIINFNVVDFDQQYPAGAGIWQAAIYPRIIQQKMYNINTGSVTPNSLVKRYETQWNIDIIFYPVLYGSCNNLAGDLLISYM